MTLSHNMRRGGPGTINSGMSNNKLNAMACAVKDARADQPRRAERSQEVSSVLNMMSSERAPLVLQTPVRRSLLLRNECGEKKKKAALARGLGNYRPMIGVVTAWADCWWQAWEPEQSPVSQARSQASQQAWFLQRMLAVRALPT